MNVVFFVPNHKETLIIPKGHNHLLGLWLRNLKVHFWLKLNQDTRLATPISLPHRLLQKNPTNKNPAVAVINPCKILTKACVVRWSYRKFKTEFKDNAIFNCRDCEVIGNILIVINAAAERVTSGFVTVLLWEGLFAGQGGAAGVSIFTAVLTICTTLALEQNIRSWNNTSTWVVLFFCLF